MKLHRLASLEALVASAATDLARRANDAIAARGRFSIALAGGNTPKPIYEALSRESIDWGRVHVFFGDERCVPPEHPRSNYRMAREALLERVAIPAAQVHRMRGELPPVLAAESYAQVLEPVLDVVLLGLGDDGHTASLFPGLTAVHEAARTVVAEEVTLPAGPEWRLTLTPPALNAARHVAFAVAGKGKAAILQQVLEGPRDLSRLPSQAIAPTSGSLDWWLAVD